MTSRIILAVDELEWDQVLSLATKVGRRVHAIKIHNIFDEEGPQVVELLRSVGATQVWVDVKLHDIPNTVRLRARSIGLSGADIITVHASGGMLMMEAAVSAFKGDVFAVTVLTSLSEEQTQLIYGSPSRAIVQYLATLAASAGVTGFVCSPQEVGMLSRRPEFEGIKFVVPGVRSVGKDAGDQQRVDTPANAVKNGATYIVVGRQITQAKDPIAALEELEGELDQAEKEKADANAK